MVMTQEEYSKICHTFGMNKSNWPIELHIRALLDSYPYVERILEAEGIDYDDDEKLLKHIRWIIDIKEYDD